MTRMWRTTLTVCCLCFLGGCYEDKAELTLNCDGSGTLKQKLVISERLIVAGSEGGGRTDIPPATKEKLLEKIGAAIDLSSVTQTELSDGGRMIEFEGTFDSVEQFFLSDFCRETMKLRLVPAGDGKAAIYCDMTPFNSGGPGPSITQLYGLAKGLFVERSIHLPTRIERTNGKHSHTESTVSWSADLRDKRGLDKTKAFVEGPEKGKGYAIFDRSKLSFTLPLKLATSVKETTKSENGKPEKDSAAFAIEPSWISVTRAQGIKGNIMDEKSNVEIGLELRWNKGHKPFRYKEPVVLSLLDDQNNDLVTGDEPGVPSRLHTSGRKTELRLKEEAPSRNAKKLKNLEGYVEVVSDVVKKKVVLEKMERLARKESVGNPILDELNFKIVDIQTSKVQIEIDGGRRTIMSLAICRENGTRIKRSGGFGGGNEYTYEFAEDIPKPATCELEVIVSEDIVRVPFSIEEMALP